MTLPKTMGFLDYLKWNYQGRPDLDFAGPMLNLWVLSPKVQFPGEKGFVVAWSKYVYHEKTSAEQKKRAQTAPAVRRTQRDELEREHWTLTGY